MTIQLDLPVVQNKANFGGRLSPREGVHGTPYEQPARLSFFHSIFCRKTVLDHTI